MVKTFHSQARNFYQQLHHFSCLFRLICAYHYLQQEIQGRSVYDVCFGLQKRPTSHLLITYGYYLVPQSLVATFRLHPLPPPWTPLDLAKRPTLQVQLDNLLYRPRQLPILSICIIRNFCSSTCIISHVVRVYIYLFKCVIYSYITFI